VTALFAFYAATPMTIAETLRQATLRLKSEGVRDAQLNAQSLLANALGRDRTYLIVNLQRELEERELAQFAEDLERRSAGEPLQYIIGHQEFYGLEFAVNPAVLIPRPETELLVELSLEREFSSVADLGTGCGAIALAIKRQRPQARVVAVESSAAALVVAQRNAVKHGLVIEFRHGRWLEPLAGECFDLIVSNPPYVAEGDPHLAGLAFEPARALVSGPDGLSAIREIVAAAPSHLAPGGWLMLEHGIGQEVTVRTLLAQNGLEEVRTWPDLAGIPRVTGGKVK